MTRPRTPTPRIDEIWSRQATRSRWHQLWIRHLQLQTQANPNHPGKNDTLDYQLAADTYTISEHYRQRWDTDVDDAEQTTRHDLAAELQIFNQRAQHTTAHIGLTSHDIVDVATQQATRLSVQTLLSQIAALSQQLADQAEQTRDWLALERTHGQPAQATLYGLRTATILAPLIDLHLRTKWYITDGYRIRPPYGAVGTAADLTRVINHGWGHQHNSDSIAARLYTHNLDQQPMLATRQTYHRVYDLHIASLCLELGSIAGTWAVDRRLETLLGLGGEVRDDGQIGSSAMPHKRNPVIAERMCSLVNVIAGWHEVAARGASAEWLGGDVSGSAARREWLPGIFRAASALLINWSDALARWDADRWALESEVTSHSAEVTSGILLQQLLDQGVPRPQAHRTVADGMVESTRALTVDGLGLSYAQRIIDQVVAAVRALP